MSHLEKIDLCHCLLSGINKQDWRVISHARGIVGLLTQQCFELNTNVSIHQNDNANKPMLSRYNVYHVCHLSSAR